MGEFSLTHWLVIAVIGIVFFGPKRLPALGQSLGESIRGFKKALNDNHEADSNSAARRETIIAAEPEVNHTANQSPIHTNEPGKTGKDS